MKKTLRSVLTFAITVLTLITLTVVGSLAASEDAKWITAWGTAPTEIGIEGYDNIAAYIGNVTARTVITPTANGSKLRIRVSNAYGEKPIKLTRVTVAKSLGGSKIDVTTLKSVTFNDGQPFVSVPAGKEYFSDPITFDVKAGEPIAISIFIEDFTEIKTMGLSGGDTYLSLPLGDRKDFTEQETMDVGTVLEGEEIMDYLSMITGGDIDIKLAYSFIKVVPCLASVEVLADENAYSVVVVGDSTVSNEFPQYLGEAINEKVGNVGVVGKGIIGNRLLGDGLGYGSLIFGESLIDRFNRDVLSQTGVKYVVVKIGANDIIHPVCKDIQQQYPGIKQPTSKEIIAGYKKLFNMCHKAGVKVVVMGITPWKGATRDYFGTEPKYVRTTAQFEADWKIACEVNAWLAKTDLHDGYVDVNSYSANPKDTAAFMPEYTTDGIHPSDKMQRVWAERFPLSLIGVGKTVGGVKISKTSVTAYAGDKFTLKAEVYPAGAKNKKVTWSSSNTKVLKVSNKGIVTCVGGGKATVICKTVDGGYTVRCEVTVRVKPSSVKLNKTSATIYTTKSVQLKATVLPENAYNKKVTWTSSNTSVATVNSKGKVTGVGSGKAVIKAKTRDGGLVAKCTVTVKAKVQVISIKLNGTKGALYTGGTCQLKATVSPANATFPEVKWETSNKKVATVGSTGKVKALSAGTAVITCRSVDSPRVVATFTLTVRVKTTGVKISGINWVYEGYTRGLTAAVSPSNASNKAVTWSSSDTKIATVDKNGKVKGIRPGKAVITCTTVNGGHTAKLTVTVKSLVRITSVSLNKTALSMYGGNTYQLTAKIAPANATVKNVSWTSSDTKVAKVDANGKVTAVNYGTAVITCKTQQGGKTATCKVSVNPVKVTSVKLAPTALKLQYGEGYLLKATVYPENASNKSLTWSSSDPKAVPVSRNGYVKALRGNSSAVITCTTVDGKKVASCTVKVAPVAVKGIKLDKTAINIGVKKSFTLVASISPTNATNKAVVWSSSDPSIASVTQSGVVTTKSGGTATIYAKTKDGGFVASCRVTVTGKKVMGVMLDTSTYSGKVGSSFTLKATIVPSDAIDKRVEWMSNDSAIATVDANGKVVCVGKGTCYIRVATVDGNYVDACKVTVS